MEGVAVNLTVLDVDDPSSNDPKVDDETKPSDNRGSSIGGPLPAFTDNQGVALFQLRVTSHKPGDNFRAVATLDPGSLSNVEAKQNDEDRAGVYFKNTGAAIPGGNARTVKSEMLTVWRRLHVERDHMKAPVLPEDGPFDGEGVGNDDVNPNGPIANPSINLMVTNYKPAYIEVVDDINFDLGWNTRKELKFYHNLEDAEEAPVGNLSRDVFSQVDYWVVQIVGSYEGPVLNDRDPDTEPATLRLGNAPPVTDGPCHIYQETIREASAKFAGAVDETTLRTRITLHESLHRFNLYHGDLYGDEGPLFPAINLYGTDDDQAITLGQLGVIRSVDRPK
jgi:hypothetical protein